MNNNMVYIIIDGKKYIVEFGLMILGVINENGIEYL